MPGVYQLSVDEAVKEAAAAETTAFLECCSSLSRATRMRRARWPPILKDRCKPQCAK